MKNNPCLRWKVFSASIAIPIFATLMAVRGSGYGNSDLPMTIQMDDPRLVPAEQRVSRALFGALHERTVDSFSKRVGFGISRIAAPARSHIGMQELWTILPPESAGYEVALIGLESDAMGTLYSVRIVQGDGVGPAVDEEATGERQTMASPYNETVELAGSAELTTDIVQLVELENPDRSVEIQRASDLDREMLDLLDAGDEAPMLIDGSGERLTAYGAIRANQQRCISCHECERGTLLGAFRYVFSMTEAKRIPVASR